MAKPSVLVTQLKKIESLIDSLASTGSGNHKLATSLRAALIQMIAGWTQTAPGIPKMLLELKFPWKTFQKVHAERVTRLAVALNLVTQRGLTQARASKIALTPSGDLVYLLGLAKRIGFSRERIANACLANSELHAEIDAHFENLTVSLDERALEDMLLAAVESYHSRSGKKGERYKECYGWCLGYETRRSKNGHEKGVETTLRVTRVVTQIRAKAGTSYVIPNDKSAQAHRRVALRFFPHMQLVGDYHTHPYKQLSDLSNNKGWQYSPSDSEHIAEWIKEVKKEGSNPRVSLIVAVAEGDKSGSAIKRLAKNRWKIGINDLHLVIAAYRIDGNGAYDEKITLKLSYLGGDGS